MSEILIAQYMPQWIADNQCSNTWSTACYLWLLMLQFKSKQYDKHKQIYKNQLFPYSST